MTKKKKYIYIYIYCMDGPVAGHNHTHIVPSMCRTGNSILMKSESKLQFNSWYVFEHLL